MVADALEVVLDELGYASTEGLVTLEHPTDQRARQYLWRDLTEKCGAQAAYFRGGVPLVAFAQVEDERQIRGLQQRLWNFSRVPVLVATTPDSASALSCFSRPDSKAGSYLPELRTSVLGSVAETLQAFARYSVEVGRHVDEFPEHFSHQGRVDAQLLTNLRGLRASFGNDTKRQRSVDALIGRSIFVRYFEDRRILTPEHLSEITPFSSYLDALQSGVDSTAELFSALAVRFNGDVFSSADEDLAGVTDEELSRLAAFFLGEDPVSHQQALWPFDFSLIPPELISSIYEQLLEESQSRDAAFYTPRRVVDLILDETIQWDDVGYPTILDPACGSGIFLTEAFRRLAFRMEAEQGHTPTFDQLSQLLTATIHGVDHNPTAVRVAALGLYMALLEQLDPPDVWRNAHLPPLTGTNILAADFFSTSVFPDRKFDVVVGNPPWKSALSEDARQYIAAADRTVPDKQIAIAFLWKVTDLLAESGVAGLVMDAKALLYNRSTTAVRARKELLEKLDIESVIDLSHLRRELFNSAIKPAAVVTVRLKSGRAGPAPETLFVPLRASKVQRAFDGFVVAQEDIRIVTDLQASTWPDIWKAMVWGGPDDFALVRRLRERFSSVADIARDRGWISNQGFQKSGGVPVDATHVAGLPLVDSGAVVAFEPPQYSGTVKATRMQRPRDRGLYSAPVVLVRRGLVDGIPVATMLNSDAAFNKNLIGIAGPERDRPWLTLLLATLNSSVGRYYLLLTSSSWGIERPFIEVSECRSLPLPAPEGPSVERVLELIAMRPSKSDRAAWAEEIDSAVADAYGVSERELDIMRCTVDQAIDQLKNMSDAKSYSAAGASDVREYVSALEGTLGTSLVSFDTSVDMVDRYPAYLVASVRLEPKGGSSADIPADGWDHASLDVLMNGVDDVSERWPMPATVVQPSAMIADGDFVHIVKPREERWWSLKAAHRDAEELLGLLVSATPADPPAGD